MPGGAISSKRGLGLIRPDVVFLIHDFNGLRTVLSAERPWKALYASLDLDGAAIVWAVGATGANDD